MTVRLVQFRDENGERRVGVPSEDGAVLTLVEGAASTYALALDAIETGGGLAARVRARLGAAHARYDGVIAERRLLPPLDHPEPHRMRVTGAGLTHLGDTEARDRLGRRIAEADEAALTDALRLLRAGLEGGRPPRGHAGPPPEWFHKGDGHGIVPPETPLTRPAFAEDGGEEPELAALYVIAPDGTPARLGFALANEFSDHALERRNVLLLAHAKLRTSSFGPELRVGALPAHVRGTSRLRRGPEVVWERPFLTGEANMTHAISNLEHHHFKYPGHRVPGDAHVHYLGTATLSFADGVQAEPGDVFEIEAPGFGRPLRNPLAVGAPEGVVEVRVL